MPHSKSEFSVVNTNIPAGKFEDKQSENLSTFLPYYFKKIFFLLTSEAKYKLKCNS